MPINFSGGTETESILANRRRQNANVQVEMTKHKQDMTKLLTQYIEHYDKKYFNMDVKEKLALDIDMNNHKLVNIAPPVNSGDSVNKQYVDNADGVILNQIADNDIYYRQQFVLLQEALIALE